MTQKTMKFFKGKSTLRSSMDGGEKMGTLDRGYEPRFKRQFKDKRRENSFLKSIETNMKGGSNDYTHNC